MPELPEVETTRLGIESLIIDKSVSKVLLHNPSLRWPVPQQIRKQLPGKKVRSVGRRAKYLLIGFDNGTLIIHLGMTGHLRCVDMDMPRRKHDHVELVFDDGTALRYNDSRRFGAVLWTDGDPLQHERLASLGPEPLEDLFDGDYLYKLSRGRKVAVKPFLMNASVVVGVGNIYASEALFLAGISPMRQAGKIGRGAYLRLAGCIKEILRAAIAAGGTTIRDFTDSDGKPGYFRQELKVYGRGGENCKSCGAPIVLTRLGQRSTYYCPKCQK